MALQIQSSPSSFLFKKPSHLLLLSPLTKPTKLKIKAKNPRSNPSPPEKKPTRVSSGRGFGSQLSTAATSSKTTSGSRSEKKRKRNRRKRASIVWRNPVGKRQENEFKVKEMSRNESAFLLAWLGLGGIILVEDMVLAASGFLLEEWDNFFMKWLYPSFIPTVGLYVAGTVACGVLKFQQNENLKDLK